MVSSNLTQTSVNSTQKLEGFKVIDAQEAELGLLNCFYIIHGLGLNNLSPDTTVFQKLPPKANSPLLNSFPEPVFLNPTLNIDLPRRDLIYLAETGLTPPELSTPEIGPWPSRSNSRPGRCQTSQGHRNQLPSFAESRGQALLPGLPFTPDGQSVFENLSYEDGCLKVKVSTPLAGLPSLGLKPCRPTRVHHGNPFCCP